MANKKESSKKKKSKKNKIIIFSVLGCLALIFCIIASSVGILVSASAIPLKGSGRLETEEREVDDFNKVIFEGKGELKISQGFDESLTIEAEDNILSEIETEMDNNTLIIRPKKDFPYLLGRNIKNTKPMIFNLQVKDLQEIRTAGDTSISTNRLIGKNLKVKLAGKGKATLHNINVADFNLSTSGSSDVSIDGFTINQQITITGQGSYKAENFTSRKTQVEITGSGNAEVVAHNELVVDIIGSGNITYIGDPKNIDQDITGNGKVERKE